MERAGLGAHAVQCFSRLVRALLGSEAVQERKTAWGTPLVVLGLEVGVTAVGLTARPDITKSRKWVAAIDEALAGGSLASGHTHARRAPQAARRALARICYR